jgi:hypothetical protein
MSINIDKAKKIFERMQEQSGLETLISNLRPDNSPLPSGMPKDYSAEATR